ncbi:MAG: DUF4838 domain-containing protein [Candidatus Hydrogenedentes bacterium]|nr:DUF4838 domain-containing protein [Candidatus Hydrogenedentota bacterium]
MKQSVNHFRFAVSSFGLILLLALPASAQVRLVQNGQAQAVIVTADATTKTGSYAAEELAAHVEKATGVKLKRVTESETPADVPTRVFIGETKAALLNGIDSAHLPREAYVIRSVGNDLFIIGREDNVEPLDEDNPNAGTLFGVYEFLERTTHVRWLWPGDLGTFVPKTGTIEISSINEMAAPALAYRSLVWSRMRAIARDRQTISEEDARLGFSQQTAHDYAVALQALLRRHRMGGLDAMPPSGHSFTGWWKKYGKEHPDWFALRKDGTRGHPDPDYDAVSLCVTNEELQDFIVEQWDGESPIVLGPVDRPGRCNCQKCRAWDGPQPDPAPWFAKYVYETEPRAQDYFAGATSDRAARFWKVIQEKAAKRNPNVLVSGSFIYENEFPAPVTGIKLNNRVYAEFVQWQDPHLRWFPMPDEAFDWIKAQWLGWKATGMRMSYRPNYLHDGYVMPHFETRQSGEFFKFAYEHGMEGARFDSLTGQWAVQGPRLYMHLRLLAKPELSIDEIQYEYCFAFGPAAGTMKQYFAYWEDYAFRNTMPFLDLYKDYVRRYANYIRKAHLAFPPESFRPAEALLQQAYDEAKTDPLPEFAERVRFIQVGLEHAQLACKLAAVFDGDKTLPESKIEEGKQALRELIAFRKKYEGMFFSDLLHVTSYWERPGIDVDELVASIATE